jgi:hypothetical protein
MKKHIAITSITDDPLHVQYQARMEEILVAFLDDLLEADFETSDENIRKFIEQWVREHFP